MSARAPMEPMAAAVPLVSVVVPTYNRAASIRMAAESVLRQTVTDLELIVVDDGSKDETLAVLNAIADPRLKVIPLQHNGGAPQARNIGIDAARSRFVAFNDSDDEWLPQKLEKQLARMFRPGVELVGVYCGMIILDTPDGRHGSRTRAAYFPDGPLDKLEGDLLPELLARSVVSTQTLIARREALLAVGGFDPALSALEDWDCALRLAARGRFGFVDEPLVVQRFSENSITRSGRKRVVSRAQIVEKNIDLFRERQPVLAAHYHAIGGGFAALGETAAARRFLRQALHLAPVRIRGWLSLIRTFLRPTPQPGERGTWGSGRTADRDAGC